MKKVGVTQVRMRSLYLRGHHSLLPPLLALGFHVPHLFGPFDLHHGGLIASKLIAVGSGSTIHGEVFSQYGPLLTWSQLPFLLTGLSAVTALHIWSIFAIVAISFLMADTGRVAPKNWNLTHKSSLFASTVWVLLSPTISTGYLFPWSSLLVAVIILGAIYMLALSQFIDGRPGGRYSQHFTLLLVGFLVGLAPFARINVGVPALVLMIAISGVLIVFAGQSGYRTAILLTGGMVVGSVSVVVALRLTDSLAAYWEQAVVFPFRWALDVSDVDYAGRSFLERLAEQLGGSVSRTLPLALLLVFVSLILRATESMGTKSARLRLTITTLISLLIVAYSINLVEFVLRVFRSPGQSLSETVSETSIPESEDTLILLAALFPLIAVVVFGTILFSNSCSRHFSSSPRSWSNRADARSLSLEVLYVGLAIALYAQIVPVTDVWHAWWAIPGALLIIVSFLRFVFSDVMVKVAQSAIFLTLLLTLSSLGILRELNADRVSVDSGSFGAGHQVEEAISNEIANQMEVAAVLSEQAQSLTVRYQVRDGSVSAIDGVFRSSYPGIVWWADQANIGEIARWEWGLLVIDEWSAKKSSSRQVWDLGEDLGGVLIHCTDRTLEQVYCIYSRAPLGNDF